MIAAVGTARVTFPMVVVMITPNIGVEAVSYTHLIVVDLLGQSHLPTGRQLF